MLLALFTALCTAHLLFSTRMFKPHQPKRRTKPQEPASCESKRQRTNKQPPVLKETTRTRNLLACSECGSEEIIDNDSETYCGECGTVIDDLLLTADYSYEATGEQISRGNYVFLPRVIGDSGEAKDRLSKYINKVNMSLVRGRIAQLSGLLGLPGLEDRAKHLFEDTAAILANRAESRIFGKFGHVYAAACVYIAGVEDGRPLTLVDLAAHAHLSVYVIGRAVKQVCTMLKLALSLKDPLLLIERTANRLFGQIIHSGTNPDILRTLEAQISVNYKVAKEFPRTIVEFLSTHGQLRPKIIEISGQVMNFARSCSLDTGCNPAAIASAAVVVGVEHAYLTDDETEVPDLKRAQRDVISKLLAATSGGSHHTTSKHVLAIQRLLVPASQTVPWLGDLKITTDTVALHVADIVSCFQKAQAWVFSTDSVNGGDERQDFSLLAADMRPATNAGDESDDSKRLSGPPLELDKLIAEMRKAPSFKRAEQTRNKREAVLGALGDNAGLPDSISAEDFAIASLARQGINREALLTLPLFTLELLSSSIQRQADIGGQALDSVDVGPNDMPDEELHLYLKPHAKEQP